MPSRKQLANAIRALSMDAVQKAKSGHPGAPMGMADIAEVLWRDFLKHNPQQKIMIQGNTDDRGTAEYNLALGQRRSDAVRRAFAALGVPDGQMEAVSLGKEKPKSEGNNETAWAENRRADIIYLTK